MPFPFSHVCDLLQQIADLPPARRNQVNIVNQLVYAWFGKHRQAVDELIAADGQKPAVALLSTLLPERRPDRVYGLQGRGLQRMLVPILGLGHSRTAELKRWERPAEYGGAVDLADCVHAILERTPNPATKKPVTVEEIDAVLDVVAARCRFSAPSLRQTKDAASIASPTQAALGSLYRRLDACGARWLTRLILKDYRPVVLDDAAVARAFHASLPMALQVHASLDAAVVSLQAAASSDGFTIKPRLGVKVGRQPWLKGRSIEDCITMGASRRMSCERKMDGEYVQVHVDLSKGEKACLQLFSKSGKDSTRDRWRLHGALRDALRIGRSDCRLTTGCILEGEMLAYDDRTGTIMDFDTIRKHVSRSGSRIFNTKEESQGHEHLMIVWYDAMLIDDTSLLDTPHADRFRRLEALVDCRPGYSEMVQRAVIDFGSPRAASQLRQAFAKCITARLEGLVIKPEDDPYFDFTPQPNLQRPYRSHCIKLKKEYIGTFGEVGDFAVIGARYDAAKALEYAPERLPACVRWTHFFIGCLDKTKSTPLRPYFVVTNVVTLTTAQMATFLTHCRPVVVPFNAKRADATGVIDDCPYDMARIEPGIDSCKGGPTELFADPPVVDIRCFSFHRQGYGQFWGPRFPCVVKFHFDRTFRDVMTFAALQTMGDEDSARRTAASTAELASDGGSDDADDDDCHANGKYSEEAHWVDRLKKADRRGIAVDAETSQSSGPTTATTQRSQSSAGASQVSPQHGTQHDTHNYGTYETRETKDGKEEEDKDAQPPANQSTVTVIDLTAEDDARHLDVGYGNDMGYDSDSDESQQGIALLFAQEDARLSQPVASSPPTTPPRSSPRGVLPSSPVRPPLAFTTSCPDLGQASAGTHTRQWTPAQKRLRTWDVSSMPAISPPALKRARSGI